MIDLGYFVEPLYSKRHEIILFIDNNEGIGQRFRPQDHLKVFKTDNGFHVNGNIDRSLWTFMEKCGLKNILATIHRPDFPNTHNRGSK
jgi:hypothetical protein